MKFILLSFFCVFAFAFTFGQDEELSLESQRDSIRKKINQRDNDAALEYIDNLYKDDRVEENSYWEGIGIYYEGRISKNNLNHLVAVESFIKAKNIFLSIDSIEMAQSANYQLYLIYYQEDVEVSLQYIEEALDLAESVNDSSEIGHWYNSLGNANIQLGNYELAMDAERKSLAYYTALGVEKEQTYALSTIGEIHFINGELDSAEFYLQKALKIKIEQSMNTGWLKSKIGKLRLAQNKPGEALKTCLEGYEELLNKNSNRAIIYNCECMYESYSKIGDYKNAYLWLLRYLELKSETESDDKKNDLARLNYEMKYKQQAIADSVAYIKEKEINEATINLQNEKIAHEASVRTYLYIGLGIVLLFSIFLFNRFQVIRKQKLLIAKKKEEADEFSRLSEHHRLIAEEKNTELIDSINYAKRIQAAILPPATYVNEALGENFVIYQPKDIVAGDFYWVKQNHGKTYFAAADCTGHGVPGAMVSVICNNALNRSLTEFELSEPGEILNKTRELITAELTKGENEVADGMDIALCSIDNLELKYAGAHNPLWLARNNEMLVTKADKQPVGKFFKSTPFKTHTLELQKGDLIYLFSDGFQDQFGGEKGKKFKAKALMKLLLESHTKPLKEQENILTTAFNNWKGNLEQLDDVCMIGVKV